MEVIAAAQKSVDAADALVNDYMDQIRTIEKSANFNEHDTRYLYLCECVETAREDLKDARGVSKRRKSFFFNSITPSRFSSKNRGDIIDK